MKKSANVKKGAGVKSHAGAKSRTDAKSRAGMNESASLRGVLRAYLTLYAIFGAIALVIGILSTPS